jgi:hypothetical protein
VVSAYLTRDLPAGPPAFTLEVHMGPKSRLLLLTLAAVLVVLAVAVPAMAASNLTKGDTKLIVPSNMVIATQTGHTTINAISPILFSQKWSNGKLTWLFDMPMAMKSGANYTNYNTSTFKGTFYHSGSLIWVDAGQTPVKSLKWQGFRIVATGKTTYSLIATVGNTAPYIPSITVGLSNHSTSITHSGKNWHIDGVQFKLQPTAQTQLKNALGETFPVNLIMFDSDIYFTKK